MLDVVENTQDHSGIFALCSFDRLVSVGTAEEIAGKNYKVHRSGMSRLHEPLVSRVIPVKIGGGQYVHLRVISCRERQSN